MRVVYALVLLFFLHALANRATGMWTVRQRDMVSAKRLTLFQHAQSWLSLARLEVSVEDLNAALKHTQKARFVLQHVALPLVR